DIHIRFRALLRAQCAVAARHAVVEQHHVVLDHAEPGGLGVPARSRRILLTLQRLALLDVCAGAVETGLFIVPEYEPDGPIGPDGHAAVAAPARGAARVAGRSGPFCPGTRWRRLIVVRQAGDVGAGVAPELGLDPVHRGAVAVGALAPVAELGEALDRRLVLL